MTIDKDFYMFYVEHFDSSAEVRFSTGIDVHQVMDQFELFLKAAGFHEKSIIDAFVNKSIDYGFNVVESSSDQEEFEDD